MSSQTAITLSRDDFIDQYFNYEMREILMQDVLKRIAPRPRSILRIGDYPGFIGCVGVKIKNPDHNIRNINNKSDSLKYHWSIVCKR